MSTSIFLTHVGAAEPEHHLQSLRLRKSMSLATYSLALDPENDTYHLQTLGGTENEHERAAQASK